MGAPTRFRTALKEKKFRQQSPNFGLLISTDEGTGGSVLFNPLLLIFSRVGTFLFAFKIGKKVGKIIYLKTYYLISKGDKK